MGRITSLSKQAIKILICFFLVFTPFFTHAAKVDWEIRKLSYQRSLEIAEPVVNIEAVRKLVNGANQTAKVQVPVNASTLGSSVKMLIKGGLASAAIYGIVEGVGWVIENGAVVKKTELDTSQIPNTPFYFRVQVVTGTYKYFDSETSARSYITNYAISKNYTYDNGYTVITVPEPFSLTGSYTGVTSGSIKAYSFTKRNPSFSSYSFYYWYIVNPNYKPEIKPQYEPVSDTELGQAIIDSPSAPTVIPDVYNPNQATDTPAKDTSATALDKAIPDSDTDVSTKPNPNKDTDGDGVPDTYDPELPDEGTTSQIPAFCDWASTMCLWYERYLDDSKKLEEHHTEEKTFWEKVEEWFDWSQDDLPDQPDSELDIPDIEDESIDSDISFGGSCPAPLSTQINFMGLNQSLEFSFDPVCQIAEFIKPVVISISAFSAALIIAGIRTEDD